MTIADTKPRLTSLAPQFLVEDLARSIAFYEKLGFAFGEPWDGFYAIGSLDGMELHLKEAPKYEPERRYRRENEHLDAAAGVAGIEAFYAQCVASGVTILRPLNPTAWGTQDFYVEDPDGYILCFGGRPTTG
jgi:catechol 2,3-dioxygenase-like lactoylglutathione lyase family enzyme